jgi:hypothetical protein
LRVVSIQKLFFYEAPAYQYEKPLKKCIKKTCPQGLQNVRYTSCLGIQQSVSLSLTHTYTHTHTHTQKKKKNFAVMWYWKNQQRYYFFAKVCLKELSPPNR